RGQIDSDTPAFPCCHGPLCSDNSVPPAVPVPKLHMAVERWAIADSAPLAILPARDSLLAEPRELPCDGFASRILLPPRQCAGDLFSCAANARRARPCARRDRGPMPRGRRLNVATRRGVRHETWSARNRRTRLAS